MDNDEYVPSPAVDKGGELSTLETLVRPECFKTSFATLFHEIRTALHQLIGYGEILIEDAEQGNYLETLAALREANADVKATQAATTGYLSLLEEPQESSLPSRHNLLRQACEKMVARAQSLERLAAREKADRLLPDLRKFEAAARNLLRLGDLIGTVRVGQKDHPGRVDVAPGPGPVGCVSCGSIPAFLPIAMRPWRTLSSRG